MQTIAWSAEKIFTGTEWLHNSALLVSNGRIQSIVSIPEIPADVSVKKWDDCFIAPAFIDVQLYGASGKLLSAYPSAETLSLINKYCIKGGTTLCLPTVATNTKEVVYACIDAVKSYWKGGGKGVWGLHLEGPWLNKIKRGAHIESLIHAPEIQEVKELLTYGKDVIKMITLAPEACSLEIIKLIAESGIIISAGHSNVTYNEAITAFNNGITTITHLYNAMSPLQHRAPGLVGAAFTHPTVKASIIADGHHVDFAAIKIAKAIMKERLFVITDAVTETPEGPYQHYLVGDKYESGGILSGSAITMFGSFKNLVQKVDVSIEEALRMCSLYPAEVLSCQQQYGKLEPGYSARAVVINKQLDLVDVISG